jgi:hypothetical protein
MERRHFRKDPTMHEPLDADYWQHQLEVPVAEVLERTEAPAFFASWIEDLSPACRLVLSRSLGLPAGQTLAALRKALLRFRSELAPFVLVDAVLSAKRRGAILEVARAVLGESSLEHVRKDDNYDYRALGWALYAAGPANLVRLMLVDRIHKRGVARLMLSERPATPAREFRGDDVAAVLSDYQRERGLSRFDPRVETLTTTDQHLVFFKWPKRRGFVVQDAKNVFGLRREWVVLAFSRDLWRVRIASDCGVDPVRIAERIAGAFFGRPMHYVNESLATPLAVADRFVASLIADESALPLVEAEVRVEPGEGARTLRVLDPGEEPIGSLLGQMRTVFGDDMLRAERMHALKVLAFGKRVRMLFEPVSEEGVVVRYTDQVFAPDERDAFERRMRETYGINVLSTEKQHAA